MTFFANCRELLAHLPNVMPAVAGEPELFAKLEPFVVHAEAFLKDNFLGSVAFSALAESPALHDENAPRFLAARFVACRAFAAAIPALDLVLTPNGFATVGNQNLVPASAERVNRLIAALNKQADAALVALSRRLCELPGWLDSPQADFFGASLFPSLDVLEVAGRADAPDAWLAFCELRRLCINAEFILAERFFSHELIEEFRKIRLAHLPLSEEAAFVCDNIAAEVLVEALGCRRDDLRIASTVDFIRKHPEVFPLWHASDTAKLFNPPVFRNSKSAHGFFF